MLSSICYLHASVIRAAFFSCGGVVFIAGIGEPGIS